MLAPWKESLDKPGQHIKKQGHHFANKGPYSQSYSFCGNCVLMLDLDHQEGWTPRNWCFQTVALEKTLGSPLDSKIKSVNPKGNQPWIFSGRTDAEAEAPILWSPDAKSQFIGKDPDAGKDWGQEEKRVAEDEIVGWHHWLNGHEWANSSRWWRTGKQGTLYSTGSQIVGHNLATEQQLKVLVKSVLRVTG